MMNKNIALFGISLAVVVADQLSKYWVLQNIAFRERVNVIPDFFDLTLVFNPGAAFSFLAGAGGWQKYFFLLLAAGICFWLAYSVIKQKNEQACCGGSGDGDWRCDWQCHRPSLAWSSGRFFIVLLAKPLLSCIQYCRQFYLSWRFFDADGWLCA